MGLKQPKRHRWLTPVLMLAHIFGRLPIRCLQRNRARKGDTSQVWCTKQGMGSVPALPRRAWLFEIYDPKYQILARQIQILSLPFSLTLLPYSRLPNPIIFSLSSSLQTLLFSLSPVDLLPIHSFSTILSFRSTLSTANMQFTLFAFVSLIALALASPIPVEGRPHSRLFY